MDECFGQMDNIMKGIGKRISLTDKDEWFLKVEIIMMETGQKAKSMGRDLKCIETEITTPDSSLLIYSMVRENSNGQMDDRM